MEEKRVYEENFLLKHKEDLFLYSLAFLKLVLPFFLQDSFYQPHRDELLYLAEGDHLSWGYLEIPPLLSVFAWITIHLGGAMFWIKIWPSLFSAWAFILCGKMVQKLGGNIFGIFLVWLPFMFGAYIRVFYLFQPNFLEEFFWIGLTYCLFNYIQTGENKWLYYLGISLGFGLLSKYSIAFYWVGLLLGLALSNQRKIYRNPNFYYGMILAGLLFLPNMIWEYLHNFPFLHHMQQLKEEQLQYLQSSDFIKNQFLMNLAFVIIWLAGLLYLGMSKETKPFRLYFWAYFTVIILLLVLKGKDYYALGAYPILFVFGAYFLEKATRGKKLYFRYILTIPMLALGIFALPILIPVYGPEKLSQYFEKSGLAKTAFCTWEDQKSHPLPQDFADMMGWRELAVKSNKVYQDLPEGEKKNTIIFCDDYCYAGALTYFGKQMGMPEPYSDVSNFLLWIPEHIQFKNIIVVRRKGLGQKDDDISGMFERARVMDSLSIPLARENGTKILLLEHTKPEFLKFIQDRITRKKSLFRRL